MTQSTNSSLYQLTAPTGQDPHVWTPEQTAALAEALREVAIKEDRLPKKHFSTIPNAHETAHLPPPTPEQEARLAEALDKIFPPKDAV